MPFPKVLADEGRCPHIVVLAADRLGGVDVQLPILAGIKASADAYVSMVFFPRRTVFNAVQRDPFLSKQYGDLVDDTLFIDKATPIRSILSLLGLVLRVMRRPNNILLHAGQTSQGLGRWLALVVRLRCGRVFEHASVMTIFHGRHPEHPRPLTSLDHAFLSFGPDQERYLAAAGKGPFCRIGYPRLYQEWRRRVDAAAEDVLRDTLGAGWDGSSRVVSILLSSTVPGVFSKADLERWLADVLAAIRQEAADAIILLKPHPMQDVEHLRGVLNGHDDLTRLVFAHAGVLATASNLVIFHHTSTVLDAMATGTPVIQHHHMTEHWLDRHPEGSAFLVLGHPHTETRVDLATAVRVGLRRGRRGPEVAEVLSHEDGAASILSWRRVSARTDQACSSGRGDKNVEECGS